MEDQDRTRLEILFEEHCTDGVVTKEAFKTILQCMDNDPTDASIDEVFVNYDADGSAGLSKDEFDEWFAKCWVPAGQAREAIAEAFKVIFANTGSEDGRHPISDLVEILKTRGDEKLTDEEAEIFQKELEIIDTNKDGTIDAEEFSKFLHEQGIEESASQEEEQEQLEQEEQHGESVQDEQTEQPQEEQNENSEQVENTEETQTTEQSEQQEEQNENSEQVENTEETKTTETTEQEQSETTEQEQSETTEQEKNETVEQDKTETTEAGETGTTEKPEESQEQSESLFD